MSLNVGLGVSGFCLCTVNQLVYSISLWACLPFPISDFIDRFAFFFVFHLFSAYPFPVARMIGRFFTNQSQAIPGFNRSREQIFSSNFPRWCEKITRCYQPRLSQKKPTSSEVTFLHYCLRTDGELHDLFEEYNRNWRQKIHDFAPHFRNILHECAQRTVSSAECEMHFFAQSLCPCNDSTTPCYLYLFTTSILLELSNEMMIL